MREETKEARRAEIEAAAYALLAEHGFGGTSMLRIAKAARASNETMYRWYGDKQGLFRDLVARNAARIRDAVADAVTGGADPLDGLRRVSIVLLSVLLGPRAIALNRAAAADVSGELGAAIAAGGRNAVVPLLFPLIERLGGDAAVPVAERTEWFLNLLIGDLQVRRVTGAVPEPGEAEIAARAERAIVLYRRLIGE